LFARCLAQVNTGLIPVSVKNNVPKQFFFFYSELITIFLIITDSGEAPASALRQIRPDVQVQALCPFVPFVVKKGATQG